MIYLLIVVGIMLLDRFTKTAVSSGMNPGETIPVLGDFFHISYVQNSGAAFSLFQNHPLILIIFPAIIISIGLIFMLVKSESYKAVFLWALALMCGGGLGNLTDRLAYGHVIDMFDFGFFPVFNVADISVCVGCGLLALYMIVFEYKNPNFDRENEQRRKEAEKLAERETKIQSSIEKKARRKAQNKAEREKNNKGAKPKRLN